MMIQIDSREQKNKHVIDYLDSQGVKHVSSKMYVGDYCEFSNPKIIVERKGSLSEWAGNCGVGHDRFKRELERLDEICGKMYIVIEEKPTAYNISVYERKNAGHRHMPYRTVFKITKSWEEKHNIEVVYVDKSNSGNVILSILTKGDTWQTN